MTTLRDDRSCNNIGVGIAEVGIERSDREHPRTSQEVATEHLLGWRRGGQWISMGNDGPRTGHVLSEVSKCRRRASLRPRDRPVQEARWPELFRLANGFRLVVVVDRFGLVVVIHVPGFRECDVPEITDFLDFEPSTEIVRDLFPDGGNAVFRVEF